MRRNPLDVQGTLVINGKTLNDHPDGSSARTVDGTIGFLDAGSDRGQLWIFNTPAVFTGDGVISASSADSYVPATFDFDALVTIDTGLTFE